MRELTLDEATREVVEFMNTYSISQEDFDAIVELSKFKGCPDPLGGIPSAVKAALTRAYKEGSKLRMVRAADFVSLPGIKKAPKKRIAAILELSESGDGIGENNKEAAAESEEENASDTEDLEGTAAGEKLQKELQSLNNKGVQVQLDLKDSGKSSAKKAPEGRGKGGSGAAEKRSTARGSGTAAKRKR